MCTAVLFVEIFSACFLVDSISCGTDQSVPYSLYYYARSYRIKMSILALSVIADAMPPCSPFCRLCDKKGNKVASVRETERARTLAM